ncbi:hypothetical protein H0H92_013542 [Tricholoma furcatifolium]|nr:hypothetical protein H0H92_013542 [Tricholoma furcatifolium]
MAQGLKEQDIWYYLGRQMAYQQLTQRTQPVLAGEHPFVSRQPYDDKLEESETTELESGQVLV